MNLLDIVFPKRCVGCGDFGRYFCDHCAKTIRVIPQNEAICPVCEKPGVDGYTHPRCKGRYTPDGLTSFFKYEGVIKKAIKSIKYRFVSDLAHEFVSLIPVSSVSLPVKNRENSTLVPIPLHPFRLRFRGFNQAEKLGMVLAKQLHIPIKTDILRRTKATRPQVDMRKREDRLKNMEKVFAVNPGFYKNLSILLFDDVFTTGATVRAAANTLKRAGAKQVWAVTMAR